MARAYHSTNISKEQQEFLKLLTDYEIDVFLITNIEKLLSTEIVNLNAILENLVKKEFLLRIEKGKYCSSNFSDEKVIGCFISEVGAIAYWSALNYHGLTEQFPNNMFIQTSKLKMDKTVLGTAYTFVKVVSKKMTGILTLGRGSSKYRITDVEKTIIDCFDLPEYSGGYAELIRAFNQAKLTSEKMIAYCTAINNMAVTKRLGFLAELLEKKGLKTFIKFAKQNKNKRYNVFDPTGIDKGEFV